MYVCVPFSCANDSAGKRNNQKPKRNETKDRLQLHAIAVTLLHMLSRENKKSIKRLRCKYLMQW